MAGLVSSTVLASLSFGSQAHAYCRESLESQSSGPCVETPGVPLLHWTRSCMTYVFNENIVARLPLLTEREIRDGFNESFSTWRKVDCGNGGSGQDAFYAEQADGFTATSKSEFLFEVRNESVVSARTRDEWAALEHDPNALALTLLWHDAETGEILDVDMELDTGAGRFANCDRPCGRDMMDLRNTITHEAGHLLGLGHSPIAGSTMLADAPDGEVEKRTLEKDDEKGYCSLDLPGFECPDTSCQCPAAPIIHENKTVTKCGCSVPGAGAEAPWSGLLALGAVGVLRYARRRHVERGRRS
jgi:MYXO-CTERM domain-containing protein